MQREEVFNKLALVYDPELDEPLTALGFISEVNIDKGAVTVQFRLPTYWCAGNFAFMMASDIRARVLELPWVKNVNVHLNDHFLDEEINEGVNSGHSFQKTFPNETTDDLEQLRSFFRDKAFHARQERLLRRLVREKWSKEKILQMKVRELTESLHDVQWKELAERFLQIREEHGLNIDRNAFVFSYPDGTSIEPSEFRSYLREASSMRLTMEFNSTFCRGMLKTRYGEVDKDNEFLSKCGSQYCETDMGDKIPMFGLQNFPD